jgi:hypothetical protein
MKPILILLFLFGFISLASAADYVNPYEEKLLWLETSDVVLDVTTAIDGADFRIKCVMGYALICPGIKNRDGLTYTVVESTGDVVTSEKHEELLNMAIEYARTYNEYIIEAKRNENAQ